MDIIRQLAFFMIFSGIMLELVAGTKYQKFVEWVVGLLLILQIAAPLAKGGGLWEKFLYRLRSFEYSIQQDAAFDRIVAGEEQAEASVQEAYERVLEEQLRQLLQKEQLVVEQVKFYFEESGVGLRGLMVLAATEQKETEEAGRQGLVTIRRIGPVSLEQVPSKTEQKLLTPKEIHLTKLLSDFYQLSEEHIYVSIQEEMNGG